MLLHIVELYKMIYCDNWFGFLNKWKFNNTP